jgi:hypothetical protein
MYRLVGGADTVKAVGDPSYLDPKVATEVRDRCSQLLQPDADVYWRAVDVFNVFGRALPDADGLYVMWGALTDTWELEPERRPETEVMMRDAAREFLSIADSASTLQGYLSRWHERLRIPD